MTDKIDDYVQKEENQCSSFKKCTKTMIDKAKVKECDKQILSISQDTDDILKSSNLKSTSVYFNAIKHYFSTMLDDIFSSLTTEEKLSLKNLYLILLKCTEYLSEYIQLVYKNIYDCSPNDRTTKIISLTKLGVIIDIKMTEFFNSKANKTKRDLKFIESTKKNRNTYKEFLKYIHDMNRFMSSEPNICV